MTIKSEKQQESECFEGIINELSNDDIENIDDYINSQNDTVNKFLKSEFDKRKNKKKGSQSIIDIKSKELKGNNDEVRIRKYLEFYDGVEGNNNQKNHNKGPEKYKKIDIHYRICRYEIFLILLFIFLMYISVQYERNFRINLSRLLGMWILSGFSSNMHIPEEIPSNIGGIFGIIFFIFDILEYITEFKKYIFFDIFFVLTIVSMCCLGGILGRGDYVTMWLILFTPIGYFIGLLIKGTYNKLKGKSKK